MDKVREAFADAQAVYTALLGSEEMAAQVRAAADMIGNALAQGLPVLFCGNGGSAADAQHLAAELSGRFYYDRPPLNADALHANTSYLTAVANDYGYEHVFSRLLRGRGAAGGVLVGISTSGNSPNIVNAIAAAREKGMGVIVLTGSKGGVMARDCDIALKAPSDCTPRIQEAHILLGHTICQLVEAKLFPRGTAA